MANSKRSVVLLEPDEAVRFALKTLLEGKGWQVHALAEGAALAGVLGSCELVAIVSESILPDMRAAEVLDASRKRKIPVVFLGHQQEVQNAVDLMRMGARDFLEKPFPQGRLLDLLDGLAEEHAD
jgi:DNA-binding NtrC family response regulator